MISGPIPIWQYAVIITLALERLFEDARVLAQLGKQ